MYVFLVRLQGIVKRKFFLFWSQIIWVSVRNQDFLLWDLEQVFKNLFKPQFLFFFFNFLVLYWDIADQQCCEFPVTLKELSHVYTCIHSPPKSPSSRLPRNSEQSSVYYTKVLVVSHSFFICKMGMILIKLPHKVVMKKK